MPYKANNFANAEFCMARWRKLLLQTLALFKAWNVRKELAAYLIVCIDSLERPISSVSTEDSLGPIFDPEFDSTQQAIFERQKKRQIKNQTLIPNSKAPMPTVRYMACW